MEDEESDDEENSSTRNGRGKTSSPSILLGDEFIFSGVELHTNEYASRHEENRLTATTKDHNMKRKLEVIPSLIFKRKHFHLLNSHSHGFSLSHLHSGTER